MARVCWRIGTLEGKGSFMSVALACAWAKSMNDKHGAGTHWLEFKKD